MVPTLDRVARLNATLGQLICSVGFPPSVLVVSCDSSEAHVQRDLAAVAFAYGVNFTVSASPKAESAVTRLAAHYRFMLDAAFDTYHADAVAIVEDDLTPAPDLGDYFLGALTMMELDDTIVCASSWHDVRTQRNAAQPGLSPVLAHTACMRTGWRRGGVTAAHVCGKRAAERLPCHRGRPSPCSARLALYGPRLGPAAYTLRPHHMAPGAPKRAPVRSRCAPRPYAT